MKKSELKSLIKPLIKECLIEVLVEEGFTKILSESVKVSTNIQQTSIPAQEQQQKNSLQNLKENRKMMLDAIGMQGFDAFRGSTAIPDAGQETPQVSVTSYNRNDPGVDISRLMTNKLKITNNAMNGKKVK